MFICGHLVECYPVTFAFAICSDTLIFSFSLCNDFRPNVCYGHIVEAFLTYHYNIIVLFAVCNCGYSTSLNNTFKLHDAHKTTKIIFSFWLIVFEPADKARGIHNKSVKKYLRPCTEKVFLLP